MYFINKNQHVLFVKHKKLIKVCGLIWEEIEIIIPK